MNDLTSQPWFGWSLLVAVGLPIAIVLLTELRTWLVRRDSSLAGPVGLLRTYVLPIAALLVLLTQVSTIPTDDNWTRITATALGFLILLFVLSSLNAALFLDAAQGSWRARMPSIFVDLARVVLIVAGLAFLFSLVWGTNIGGLFAALGVTSIVLGLALQNAVGSIISGLLLLFEQPFQLGDWLDTGTIKGRVIEVNWRAVHIETTNGVQITPNAALAGSSFKNLSRPENDYTETVESTFGLTDPPLRVMRVLNDVASGLSGLAPDAVPSTVLLGEGKYATSIPLQGFPQASVARATFVLRLWYAARRANLSLDGADIWHSESAEDVAAVLPRFASALRISSDAIPDLARQMDLERYAPGEIIAHEGEIPKSVRYVVAGRVALTVADASSESLRTLSDGDAIGYTALTREPAPTTVTAVDEATLLVVPQAILDALVRQHPDLARDIGHNIDQRRQLADSIRTSAPAWAPLPGRLPRPQATRERLS